MRLFSCIRSSGDAGNASNGWNGEPFGRTTLHGRGVCARSLRENRIEFGASS